MQGSPTIWASHDSCLVRESVFAGTTNKDDYLKDETGARRFWPIRCRKVDIKLLAREKDQLWAEAVHRFRQGEHWWIQDEDVLREAGNEQEDRYEADPWDELIAEFVKDRDSVSLKEILIDCLKKGYGRMEPAGANPGSPYIQEN